MSTALDRLLDSIHPQRTLEEVERRADEALINFRIDSPTITDWNAFRSCMARLLRHLEIHVLHAHEYPDVALDFQWGRCMQLLDGEYGPNGEKAAFEIARTGNEGGLYMVLKALARAVVKRYGGSEVSARVLHFWNSLSAEEKIAATTEYLNKYGHLLPSELTEGSAGRLRAEFPKVLTEHPELLRRLGRVGRQ